MPSPIISEVQHDRAGHLIDIGACGLFLMIFAIEHSGISF